MTTFKSIRERNAEFDSLSLMEKRVALAKDVLAQLELKKFSACSGTYILVQDQNTENEVCNVCALGSLVMSLVDGEAVDENGYEAVGCAAILDQNDLWTWRESDMIEAAFEGWQLDYYNPETGDLEKQYVFSRHSQKSTTRLRVLMENIVRNSGNFNPEEYQDTLRELEADRGFR